MRYIGSKASSVYQLFELITKICQVGSICDPFGGIGIIGSFFKNHGFNVITGDHLIFAHYFQISKITLNRLPQFRELFKAYDLQNTLELSEYINSLPPADGWFVEEYSKKRNFFLLENARHIEKCRQLFRIWELNGLLTYNEKALLYASLINSMDKIANTAGTYYAYLKQLYRKAKKPFKFAFIVPITGCGKCKSYLLDAEELVKTRHFNILYLDPPYNDRSYSRYYHLPETIAKGITPILSGKAGIPISGHVSSAFNKKSTALLSLQNIITAAKFDLLAFNYSAYGIIDIIDIERLLSSIGKYRKYLVSEYGYVNNCIPRKSTTSLYLVTNA
ncbi:MAG: DNA adenine methylase [Thermodesulfobacteriota bacterium]